jgi:chromosome segregation ATPase
MLLLFDESLIALFNFLQVFLWISIPALLIGMLITTVIHYNNKRKKTKNLDEPFIFESVGSATEYDDVSLMPLNLFLHGDKQETRRIMNYLSHSNARYIAIQKDFKVLTKKYQQLQVKSYQNFETKKNKTMETIHPDLQQIPYEQIDSTRQEYELEKKELLAELNQLTISFENLEKDNISLREQLNVYCDNGTGFTSMIQKWDEEKAELKKRINEQEYLKDVMEEKKQQIVFLQQQLEQRIKNHHLVELQFRELGIKFMDANEKLEIKEQSIKEFQATVHDKEQEIIFLKEVVQSAAAKAVQLETAIKDMQEQNSKFSFELDKKNDLINELQAQLTEISEAKIKLEERLERSQTFIKGFHRKLSDILQEEIPESPVIVMKTVYKEENKEQFTESAIQ